MTTPSPLPNPAGNPSREELARIIDPDAKWGKVLATGSDDNNQILLALEKAADILARLAAKPADDGVREAFKPFSDFMAGSVFDKLPDEMALTNGSGMARRQLTVGDFRKLRETIWPPTLYARSPPIPGERK